MDDKNRKSYQTACRSAAAGVLLSQTDLESEAFELAHIYKLKPTLVSRDIDLIIQNERHKVSGVFKFDGGDPKRRRNGN